MLVATAVALVATGAYAKPGNGNNNGGNTPGPCADSNVQVTGYEQFNGTGAGSRLGPNLASGATQAAACFSSGGNAIPISGTAGGANLGYQGDGLFNGAPQGGNGSLTLNPGAFITSSQLSNLQGKGNIDPGWILIGSLSVSGNTFGTFTPAAIGGQTLPGQANFFSISGSNGNAQVGTWSLTPSANVAQELSSVLGRNFFDQFSIVFQQANGIAAYDFTAAQFGITQLDASNPVYNWEGTYNVSSVFSSNPGLSDVYLYARDPADEPTTQSVPEPGTFALVGLTLVGLAALRKRG